jgi:hypothetical protein
MLTVGINLCCGSGNTGAGPVPLAAVLGGEVLQAASPTQAQIDVAQRRWVNFFCMLIWM